MLASEIVHECRYDIVDRIYVTFPDEFQGVLIFDKCSQKYNFYILNYLEATQLISAHCIISRKERLPLEDAIAFFPNRCFDIDTYGF